MAKISQQDGGGGPEEKNTTQRLEKRIIEENLQDDKGRLEEKNTTQRLEKRIISKTSTLIMSAFGFVTALAWNDAVQTTLDRIFGKQTELWAKYIYASFLTAMVVLIAVWLDRVAKNLTKEEKKTKEDDE